MAELSLIVSYVAFLMAMIFISSVASRELILNRPDLLKTRAELTPPDCTDKNPIICAGENLGWFFKLMMIDVSPEINWLKVLIITPLLVGLFYVIIKLVISAIPFTGGG